MTYVGSDSKIAFLDQLGEMLKSRLSRTQAPEVRRFAEQMYASAPMEDLQGGRIEDFFASVILSWKFIQHYEADKALIRVFNPDLEEHGWQSTHTVIEILHTDCPFLVESVRMELNRREIYMHRIQEAILRVRRDANHDLEALVGSEHAGNDSRREVLLHIEVDRHTSDGTLEDLRAALADVLDDVRMVNSDFSAMKERCEECIRDLRTNPPPLAPADVAEVAEFMSWLLGGQFTFLGFDELMFLEEKGERFLEPARETALGIRRKKISSRDRLVLRDLAPNVQGFLQAPKLITVTKSSTRSRVHRPAYPDYVSIRQFNERGEVISERRFLGLFTAKFYNETLSSIPLVRRKVADIIARSGIDTESHAGKAFMQILHKYPRDELLETSSSELFETVMGILNMQERRLVRLFTHRDPYNKFVTALVYCPRDIFSTELRLRFQDILVRAVNALDADFTTHLSESVLARVHFVLRVDPTRELEFDPRQVEEEIRFVTRSWTEDLHAALIEHFGEERGNELFQEYREAFPAGYREDFSARNATADIQHILDMDRERNLGMSFYRAVEEDGQLLRFKLFQVNKLLPLSEVLPILENLGLCVMAEHPFDVYPADGSCIWIRDFSLEYRAGGDVDLHKVKENFLESFAEVWAGRTENDGFNRLVLSAGFSWREVAVFRAYARYNKQIRFGLSEMSAADTLVRHADIGRMLLDYFELRFDPHRGIGDVERKDLSTSLTREILARLDAVESLDEDRILRRYLELMNATLRTNFYQLAEDGRVKDYVSFKIDCRAIAEIPRPRPMFEIFVYSPRVEGVHLRGGKVARGGLRWSDRMEDFRTEVLGLVKAQQVKNAVIVPVGAKGGFVAKRPPVGGGREEFLAEGIACYKTFIRALLDITDNLKEGQVVPPSNVVRHDEDDFYLVVAADKGTATFSDIANGIADEYGHWLGDAFASGGSVGYDHKGMGITARGAWVGVQRHFREIGIDVQKEDFTCIAVGDMAGDVFGNGMLLSEHIRLVAAFNHMHIFVDPDPDSAASFKERKRLFELPRSSWADYDSKLISKGGGVFNRSAKSIPISSQMKKRFSIDADKLTPNELLKAILQARVDLFWNGGIGTYVKAKSESHLDVGDKANDAIRINGGEFKVRVVGEGGNLGMTQLGRIEYCLAGGRCNTDFIDNAGGVDCSDHEVNIKILLNEVVEQGDMTTKQRNKLLASMTDDVADLVLLNNYRQTQAISIAESEVVSRMEEYRRFISSMESAGKLDRALEFLPDDESIVERKLQRKGLTRPELSVLISYCKADLKEQLINSKVPDDPYLQRELETAFPAVLVKRYRDEMYAHRLYREIAATQIANDMANRMGITFVHRLTESTGTKPSHVARSYIVARDVFNIASLWEQIEELDHKVDAAVQMEMMTQLIRLARRGTRWFIRNRRAVFKSEDVIQQFRPGIAELAGHISELVEGVHQESLQSKQAYLVERNVPEELAKSIAQLAALYNGLGIIEASRETGRTIRQVAEAFFKLGDRLQLHWFSRQITDLTVENHWQAMARETFRDDLDWQRRSLTTGLLQMHEGPEEIHARIDAWVDHYKPLVDRWQNMLNGLRSAAAGDFAMYAVAVRELLDLAQSTTHRPMSAKKSGAGSKKGSGGAGKTAAPDKKSAPAASAETGKKAVRKKGAKSSAGKTKAASSRKKS